MNDQKNSGACYFLGNCLLSWQCKKQTYHNIVRSKLITILSWMCLNNAYLTYWGLVCVQFSVNFFFSQPWFDLCLFKVYFSGGYCLDSPRCSLIKVKIWDRGWHLSRGHDPLKLAHVLTSFCRCLSYIFYMTKGENMPTPRGRIYLWSLRKICVHQPRGRATKVIFNWWLACFKGEYNANASWRLAKTML